MGGKEMRLSSSEGAITPPRIKRKCPTAPDLVDAPIVNRRSDRIRRKMVDDVKDGVVGDTIKTPRGSSIHSLFPKQIEFLGHPESPRRVELDKFKRRLQFKSGTRSSVMLTDAYKTTERKEKMREYQEHLRRRRNTAQLKSRGLSLPAASKTRKTRVLEAKKEGEAPLVQFVPRHNLRPRLTRLSVTDQQQPADLDAIIAKGSQPKGNVEKRMKQYKRLRSRGSIDFTSWKDRDEEWRSKRLANYLSSSKTAREATLFKKRNLSICGWGNAQKNLGNYLSICWNYNPDLNADMDQKLPGLTPCILNRTNTEGQSIETGIIYRPEILDKQENEYLNGYCFSVQSELALKFEAAQQALFNQANDLVQRSFYQYNMDLSLDSSLDDNFTIDIFVSSAPSQDLGDLSVRGVTQFIFMKSYIYLDKICVSNEHQKRGIGKFMMERIVKFARLRNKDILLYALGPVVDMYKNWGFEYCVEWPPIPKDIGAIMRKRIRTEGVANQYKGLEWNGTSFS